MAMTHEQLEALRPGDIVELIDDRYSGFKATGPLVEYDDRGALTLGPLLVRDQRQMPRDSQRTITVITPAPATLYLNHPRTAPVNGDVALEEIENGSKLWFWQANSWHDSAAKKGSPEGELTLMVDGATHTVLVPVVVAE